MHAEPVTEETMEDKASTVQEPEPGPRKTSGTMEEALTQDAVSSNGTSRNENPGQGTKLVKEETMVRRATAAKEQNIEPSSAFLDICQEIDPEMDQKFIAKAWKQYDMVRKQCVLEGKQDGWYGCALYMAQWQGAPLEREAQKKYPLSMLIRICKIR
ncbi:unnamed protein product [Gongylonema pulchrum]|uniref:BUB1 N-terminal domain-containing protein n=1 Tax=Gongylonema pulchrum TaxID=637853 RepID=A0A183EP12_9BILA|nr:unnamed protein product [Gongylonema pulchrum]